MKFLKGNQVIIYVIALMLMTAGYLNYTTKQNNETTQTSATTNSTEVADIGDAKLVNSEDVVTESPAENSTENNTQTGNTEATQTVVEETSPEASPEQVTEQTTVDPADYFATSKLEREKMYSQMIEIYEKVLNNSNSLETQKQSATEEIQKINNTKNSIMICENLIKTKGFDNSVIFVNGDSVNIIIGTTTLEKEQVAQIQNIIEREMKVSSENIHIATK